MSILGVLEKSTTLWLIKERFLKRLRIEMFQIDILISDTNIRQKDEK